MNRYFLYLSYKGAGFHGWQIQEGVATIQEEIEKALGYKLGSACPLTGAGRTDTGVHARFFVAHFEHDRADLAGDHRLIGALNSALPKGIAIHQIRSVDPEAHARFSALSRTYVYQIQQHKAPFLEGFSWFHPQKLDVERMRAATQALYRHIDFTSFSKLHTQVKTNNCRIIRATWDQKGSQLIFTIEADRFLRNMVRAIVGTLVEVGKGNRSVDGFEEVIQQKDRKAAGKSAPAEGLFLNHIQYPEELFI